MASKVMKCFTSSIGVPYLSTALGSTISQICKETGEVEVNDFS
jgi:hypothetical protein